MVVGVHVLLQSKSCMAWHILWRILRNKRSGTSMGNLPARIHHMLRRISAEGVDPRKWWPKVQTKQRKSAGARPLISDRRVLLDEIRRDPNVGTNNNNLPFPRPLALTLQYRSVGCEISKSSGGNAVHYSQSVWRIDTWCS